MKKKNNSLDWSNLSEKSRENMESARHLCEKENYTSAISRMYYALFQLIYKEMLDKHSIEPEKDNVSVHEEAFLFLSREVVDEQKFIVEIFKKMRGARRRADYLGDCFKENIAKNLLQESENLHKQLLSNVRKGREVLDGYTKT